MIDVTISGHVMFVLLLLLVFLLIIIMIHLPVKMQVIRRCITAAAAAAGVSWPILYGFFRCHHSADRQLAARVFDVSTFDNTPCRGWFVPACQLSLLGKESTHEA